jgi:hypothetical protein
MKKSKLLTFILSFLPGLSHLYLGFPDRALIFFGVFAGVCMGGACIGGVAPGIHLLGPLLFFGLAIVWFLALVDAFSLIDKNGEETPIQPLLSNRKIIAVALSIIPGAGHMYLGLLKQGAQFMAAFFFFLFMSSWLRLELLVFVLPVIWFYSIFDAYHMLVEESEGLRPDESPLFDWFNQHPGWMGWGLIILGVLALLQRIITPVFQSLIDYDVQNYIQTGLVALFLIAGGVALLKGSHRTTKKEDESCDNGE